MRTMRRPLMATLCCVLGAGGVGRAQEDTGRFVALRGMVVDTALRPVPGALVYLASAGIFSVSDDTGWFTLTEIEIRLDTLHVRGRGFMPRSFSMDVPDSLRGTIDVGPVTLDPGPLPTLALTATLRDTLRDQPVAGAQVMVNEHEVGETDTTGVFSATEIPVDWGINVVLVRRVGYAPLFHTFWVGELDTRRSLTGVMEHQAVELPHVVVEADRIIFSYRRMRDFWRRREQGWGRYFTREDIERRHPLRVSDMLRSIPFLSVSHVGATTEIQSTWSGRRCAPSIWIDGVRMVDWDLDALVHPQDVEAIEVYRGIGTPVEFAGLNDCGAIVIWTR